MTHRTEQYRVDQRSSGLFTGGVSGLRVVCGDDAGAMTKIPRREPELALLLLHYMQIAAEYSVA
jgi:hypothetical protein